jgi:hypothetical protein
MATSAARQRRSISSPGASFSATSKAKGAPSTAEDVPAPKSSARTGKAAPHRASQHAREGRKRSGMLSDPSGRACSMAG